MNLKVKNDFFDIGYEDLDTYCDWLKRKNTVVLFLLESYIGNELNSNEQLLEIKNIILDVGNDISRLSENIVIFGDDNEGL